MRRRSFLKAAAGSAGGLALGGLPLGCGEAVPPFEEPGDWSAGEVAHLLPGAGPHRILLKASFRRPRPEPPVLHVGGARVPGERSDGEGRFFAFDARGLAADTRHTLELRSPAGERLCDPWPLRTLPAADAEPERVRVLFYTCAGGPEIFYDQRLRPIFRPLAIRRRLLARALAFEPDLAVANGDHVYWDLRSSPAWALGRSPQAWWTAGWLDRAKAPLGTENEPILKEAFGPQLAGLYGTLFRSLPCFFVQDDHDYTENDEATRELRTFPPDGFMRAVARATQRLYYPEHLATPRLPSAHVGAGGLAPHYGELRFGRLLEALLYDCRRHLTNPADPASEAAEGRFVPEDVERWLRARTARGRTRHLVHAPSTPVLWTAGKWLEWYPDAQADGGGLAARPPHAYWAEGWGRQHDRLLHAASSRRDRTPLFVSGDLHATAAGRILGTRGESLRANPVVSVLSGTLGSGEAAFPSSFRGQGAVPSETLEAEEWLPPQEVNGFALLDATPDRLRLRLFRWSPEEGVGAIDALQPFETLDLPRPG